MSEAGLNVVTFNTGYPDPQDKQEIQRNIRSGLAPTPDDDVEEQIFDCFLDEYSSGKMSSLSLSDYVRFAAEVDWSVLDSSGDEWYSDHWHFVRCMKGHPKLAGLNGDSALNRIIDAAMKSGGLEELLGDSEDAIALEFLTVWDKIRYRPGWTPLENAAAHADEVELIPVRCNNGRNSLYGRFISIAGWLQVTMGNRNILLPIDRLSQLLGCDRSRVSQLRQLAVMDGFLEEVREHLYRPGGGGRATEFRFDVTKFKILDERTEK